MDSDVTDVTYSGSATFSTFTTNDFLTLQWDADTGVYKIFKNTGASAIATSTFDGTSGST